MPAGTLQTILVCEIGFTADPHVPCPAGTGAHAIQAYILSPASQDFFEAVVVPFDPAQAATFFMTALCTTIFFAWFSWHAGEMLDMVKRILGIKN